MQNTSRSLRGTAPAAPTAPAAAADALPGAPDPAPALSRRHLLCCGALAAAGLFSALAAPPARAFIRNPCRSGLPAWLAQHDVVLQAFEGLDASQLWDVHTHLLGVGDGGTGCTINRTMSQWWHPLEVIRKQVILNAACVDTAAPSIDQAYVQRLHQLVADFPQGARWLLYAFDHALDEHGREHAGWTTFHVPDRYAAEVAAAQPQRYGWVASVHPYREDAVPRLRQARQGGAVALKWLPGAMNIDLRSPRLRPVYDELARSGMPMIVHCGEEKAVPGAGRDDLGNPLLLRHPLEAGVRVIAAHCASLGHAADLDKPSETRVLAFDLFARLMDESLGDRLMGDISALFQVNRPVSAWHTVLARADWHERLLHGSDYPLPGIGPLVRPGRLVREGLLDEPAVAVLERVREYNPLLFDLALKRAIRRHGAALPAAVFHTRRAFEPVAPARRAA